MPSRLIHSGMKAVLIAAQLAVALSVLNVWLLRRQVASPWRGGGARNLPEEFAAYGLTDRAMKLVGFAKVTCAVLLLAGLFLPDLVRPASIGVAMFMTGAIAMHVKIADPIRKSIPAATLLVLAIATAILPA
jgi:hypothetical protein